MTTEFIANSEQRQQFETAIFSEQFGEAMRTNSPRPVVEELFRRHDNWPEHYLNPAIQSAWHGYKHALRIHGDASDRLQSIRKAMGYVENGSDTTVKLFQDDATRDFIIKVGRDDFGHSIWGNSFEAALSALAKYVREADHG